MRLSDSDLFILSTVCAVFLFLMSLYLPDNWMMGGVVSVYVLALLQMYLPLGISFQEYLYKAIQIVLGIGGLIYVILGISFVSMSLFTLVGDPARFCGLSGLGCLITGLAAMVFCVLFGDKYKFS